jgi:hypothetical protein
MLYRLYSMWAHWSQPLFFLMQQAGFYRKIFSKGYSWWKMPSQNLQYEGCYKCCIFHTGCVTGVAYRDLDTIWLSRWNRNKTLSCRHLGTSQSDAGKGRVFERNKLQQVDRDGRDSS